MHVVRLRGVPAGCLPVQLPGMPAGALGDLSYRRRLLLDMQGLMLTAAAGWRVPVPGHVGIGSRRGRVLT